MTKQWQQGLKTSRMQLAQETQLATLDASDAEKVGLVFVDGLNDHDPKILLTRVKPKNPGDVPDLALPRGTRDVQDPQTGLWHDPRLLNKQGIDTQGWRKEPVRPALVREAFEEVGVTEDSLSQAPLHEVGIHPFTSRKGDQFSVHWFASPIQLGALDDMKTRASDATQLAFMKLSELDRMAAEGSMNPCYAQVAHQAVDGMRRGAYPQYVLAATAEAQPTR